jgi:hypothetical protein
VPYYTGGHKDALLDSRLRRLPNLLHITPEIWAHFGSSLRYSTTALPVNTLLDTLIRPNADTELNFNSFVKWRYQPELAIPHVVFVKESQCGGVWVDSPDGEGDDAGTLSYAEMLSLPGYSFQDHFRSLYDRDLPELERPSKADVASYFASYPAAVGIASSFRLNSAVSNICRTKGGFFIQPFSLVCKQLVLATGIFDHTISPPGPLALLTKLNNPKLPVLVVGSGYSAADAIVSTAPTQPIIHVFRWYPKKKPSPLQGCHSQAYPEYARIYRQMKEAAGASKSSIGAMRKRTKSILGQRDWKTSYEGLSNAQVESVSLENHEAKVKIRLENGQVEERRVGALDYFVGRRGSLSYLDASLRREVVPPEWRADPANSTEFVSGRTLRSQVEADTEVAPAVYVIGSLTGDSLIRHAFGTCIQTASHLIERCHKPNSKPEKNYTQGCLCKMDCASTGGSDDAIRIES